MRVLPVKVARKVVQQTPGKEHPDVTSTGFFR